MSDLKLTIRRAVPDDAAAYALILGDDSVFPGTLQLPYPTEPLSVFKWFETDGLVS